MQVLYILESSNLREERLKRVVLSDQRLIRRKEQVSRRCCNRLAYLAVFFGATRVVQSETSMVVGMSSDNKV